MAKKKCAVCGKELGFFSFSMTAKDGVICESCLNNGGYIPVYNSSRFTVKELLNLMAERRHLNREFTAEETPSSELSIDFTHKLFSINRNVYRFSELLDFDIYETEGETEVKTKKHGIGRAVAGGLLFGAAGAVVGGMTGKTSSTQTEYCQSLELQITLQNAPQNTEAIDFIRTKTKKNSSTYRSMIERARECAQALQRVAAAASDPAAASISTNSELMPSNSAADEILKFKNLADAGIITQEEFEAKKKQLLGL